MGGLPYWVRGLEWPGAATETGNFDEQGRLKQLSQAGWQVSYLDWAPAGVAGLPSKLDLQGAAAAHAAAGREVERWGAVEWLTELA